MTFKVTSMNNSWKGLRIGKRANQKTDIYCYDPDLWSSQNYIENDKNCIRETFQFEKGMVL